MSIGFVRPLYDITRDQRVTAGEVTWATQEMGTVVAKVMIISFMLLLFNKVLAMDIGG